MKTNEDSLLILSTADVASVLTDNENAIVDTVKEAYELHQQGKSSLPHSIFLRFPEQPSDRIIGLPAYIDGETPTAGMKWIASFPGNIQNGIDRASAVIILNDMQTGRPYSILEGSIISAKRTAASAALAAKILCKDTKQPDMGLIGCGLINFETFSFVTKLFPSIKKAYIFDLDPNRAAQFADKVRAKGVEPVVCKDLSEVLKNSKLVSFATTAGTPHVTDPSLLQPDSTILHVSLRDLSPEVIKNAVNVVDDLNHVNRENTSIYLTSQAEGNTEFVLAQIGELLLSQKKLPDDHRPIIFSPFGLGVLDMKLSRYVYEQAVATGKGYKINDFLPTSWAKTTEA